EDVFGGAKEEGVLEERAGASAPAEGATEARGLVAPITTKADELESVRRHASADVAEQRLPAVDLAERDLGDRGDRVGAQLGRGACQHQVLGALRVDRQDVDRDAMFVRDGV